jgi:hypothetical protein
MQEAVMSPLNAWDTFYVIIGSSAAALTGLMFVVISLLPSTGRRAGTTEAGISVFCTPTIVHFSAVLLVSAMLTSPWPVIWQAGVAMLVSGVIGMSYVMLTARRMRHVAEYKPVFEDWLCHTIVPFAAYGMLLISGLILARRPAGALAGVAISVLSLLFIGIHNAWDTVTYVAFQALPPHEEPKAPAAEPRTMNPEP